MVARQVLPRLLPHTSPASNLGHILVPRVRFLAVAHLPRPSDGLEAALIGWASVANATLIKSDIFSMVYFNFIGSGLYNRNDNDSPETFFFDMCEGE